MIYYVTLQTRRAAGFRRKITYFAKELEDAIRECEEMARVNKRYIWRVYTPQWQLIYTAKEETMNNNLFARELKQRFPDQIIVAQAGPYQDVLIVCYDSLYFSDAFRDLLTARSARLVNWTRDLQPLGHDSDHCMQMTIAPKHREYWAQDRRRQISLKLSPESDAVLLEYLDHVDNIQGLIKSLLMDHIAAKESIHAGAEG